MRNVLLVIPELIYSGAASELCLLALGLRRECFQVRVCVLGKDAMLPRALGKAGVEIEVLGWNRAIDLPALWRLGRLLHAFRPDVIHVWRLSALRTLLLAGGGGTRLIVSSLFRARAQGKALGILDRGLLR